MRPATSCSTRCWSAIRTRSSSSPSTASSTSSGREPQKTPPGTWVEGYFFDDTKVKDNRALNVHDLDQVSKDHPVVVHHRGGHTSFYNSKALQMAGITKNTAESCRAAPMIEMPNGELNGRVTDRAHGAFDEVGKRATFTPEEAHAARPRRPGLHLQAVRPLRPDQRAPRRRRSAALQQVRARGELLHRVSYEAQAEMLEAMINGGMQTGFGDEWITLGATSRAHRRRLVLRAHHGAQHAVSRRRRRRYKGNVTETQEDLNAWVERVHRAGIQVNCHANGDVAIDMC